MKKHVHRFLLLTVLFEVCALFGTNVYVQEKKNWSEARNYCIKHYTDLSSISSKEEDDELLTGRQPKDSSVWIGLYKEDNDMWKWSGEVNASYFNWAEQNNTSEENSCVAQDINGWHKMNCDQKFHFYCFNNLVLVKENKTWEEAMELCRYHHTDLVSLHSESAMVQTLQTSREAQTDHMWLGLRYMADSWLWVNGDNMEYQAWRKGETPQCPTWRHHCGALSLEGKHWDSWDCADKLNFVCY